MTDSQAFWPVECQEGEPDLFVCMDCLNEVYRSKVPIQGCPGCGAVSAFEPFTFESIQEWGSEELIAKARMASRTEPRVPQDSALSIEGQIPSQPNQP